MTTAEDLKKYVSFSAELAERIGERLREVALNREHHAVHFKGGRDLLTEYDLWSENEIKKAVQETFPEHLVIGEESSGKLMEEKQLSMKELLKQGYTWIVDPIDGTTNFSHGIPHFGVSIAFAAFGEVLTGVVYEPCKRELFTAARGQGAFLNGSPIQVTKKDRLYDSVIATGFPYNREELWGELEKPFREVLLNCRDIRRLGAASLDICYVACGRFDGYYEFTLNPWDIAAGHVIVSEAGGYSQAITSPLGSALEMPVRGYGCGSGKSFEELLRVFAQ